MGGGSGLYKKGIMGKTHMVPSGIPSAYIDGYHEVPYEGVFKGGGVNVPPIIKPSSAPHQGDFLETQVL
jgi:hypothetical protein